MISYYKTNEITTSKKYVNVNYVVIANKSLVFTLKDFFVLINVKVKMKSFGVSVNPIMKFIYT
jgi:hypothetical protein